MWYQVFGKDSFCKTCKFYHLIGQLSFLEGKLRKLKIKKTCGTKTARKSFESFIFFFIAISFKASIMFLTKVLILLLSTAKN